ncbi:MAG: glycosyltransferase family 2 protein [Planctomycetes bacterium]|nr:glycosyltransferase family 2 protein [Planctomycetota bacterium]
MARLNLPPLAPADYRISVVLPVFAETDSVREVANWLREKLGARMLETIIVLSPKSGPASRAVCDELCAADPRFRIHVQQVNPGLGNAVKEGYALTRGNLVLNMDSDGEMENETVSRMLEAMEAHGYEMVVASRWMKGGGFSGYDRKKYLLNWGFQQLFRILYLTRVNDLTYGFKLMRGELARGIAWDGTLHEIACETTMKPIKLGAKVGAVPSKWTARVQGQSKNTFWRTFRYVGMALKIWARGATLESAPAANAAPRQP